MKLKITALIGLIFLTLNQTMLLGGNEFIQNQQPIDYAHWLLFIGVLLCLPINMIFTKSQFSNIASILTSLGVVALLGQATIDFLWWSYGNDYDGMNQLHTQIMENASLRIPFMTLGPALFYFGLTAHALKFMKTQTFWCILVFVSTIGIGLGAFTFDSRLLIVLCHVVLSIGFGVLIFKYQKKNITLK